MPRWSKTTRSRVASAERHELRGESVANGSAAWPGPPASATTASVAVPGRRELAADRRGVTVPGIAPVGSNGTTRWPQPKAGASAQVVNGTELVAAGGARGDGDQHDGGGDAAAQRDRAGRRRRIPLRPYPIGIARRRSCPPPGYRLAVSADRETVHARRRPRLRSAPTATPCARGELLFCSGQIPLDPSSGELVAVSAGAQARRCLENLEAVCARGGHDAGAGGSHHDLHGRDGAASPRSTRSTPSSSRGSAGAHDRRRRRAAARRRRSRSTRSSRSEPIAPSGDREPGSRTAPRSVDSAV